MIRLLGILVGSFLSFSVIAQVSFSGIVLDENRAPIPFADALLLKAKNFAMTNDEGRFTIHFDPRYTGMTDTLAIYANGYYTHKHVITLYDQLVLPSIQLNKDAIELPTTAIRATKIPSPKEMIALANKQARKNYGNKPKKQTAFYRELLKDGGVSTMLNEAVCELTTKKYPARKLSKKSFHYYFDHHRMSNKIVPKTTAGHIQSFPFFTKDYNAVDVLEVRQTPRKPSLNGKIETLDEPFGGPADLLSLNWIKYGMKMFYKKSIDNYQLKLLGEEILNDSIPCYVIKFDPIKPTNKKARESNNKKRKFALLSGKVFISVKDYALARIEARGNNYYEYTHYFFEQNISTEIKKHFYPTSIDFQVDFKKEDANWRLDNISANSIFEIDNHLYKWNRQLTFLDTIISNDGEKTPFPFTRISLRTLGLKYNAPFWSSFEKEFPNLSLSALDIVQLENVVPLETQFGVINEPISSIPKPKLAIEGANLTEEEKSIAQLKNIDAYSNTAVSKMQKEINDFVTASLKVRSRIYNKDFITQLRDIKTDTDSTGTKFIFQLQEDNTYKKRVNLTQDNDLKNRGRIENLMLHDNVAAYLITYPHSVYSKLKIVDTALQIRLSMDSVYEYKLFPNGQLITNHLDSFGRADLVMSHTLSEFNIISSDTLLHEPNKERELTLTTDESNKTLVINNENKRNISIHLVDLEANKIAREFSDTGWVHYKSYPVGGSDSLVIVKTTKTGSQVSLYTAQGTLPIYETDRQVIDGAFDNNFIYLVEYDAFDDNLRVIDKRKAIAKKLINFGDYSNIHLLQTDSNVVASVSTRIEADKNYSLKGIQVELVKEPKTLVNNFDAKNYQLETLMIPLQDGTEMPLLVAYKKELPNDSIRFILASGYGAYGKIEVAGFDDVTIAELDRGMVYVVPGTRGTSVKGLSWYKAGTGLQKENTFTDFIAGVRFVQQHFNIKPQRTFARGTSAGGMIMGVMANRYADEFGGLIFDRPYLDVLNSMMDTTALLTTLEYSEWGNPLEQPYYDYIKNYCPAANQTEGAATNIFIRASQLDYVTTIDPILSYATKALEGDKLTLMLVDEAYGHMVPYSYSRAAKEYAFMQACMTLSD